MGCGTGGCASPPQRAEISKVTDTLSTGRYALACVEARLAGRPLPALRVPCFFNPQHGPSVREVMFTPRGRGTRRVPACARDAARVEAGERPEVRTTRVGARAGSVADPWGVFGSGHGDRAHGLEPDGHHGAGGH